MMHVLNWGWIVFAISVQAFVTTQKHDGGKSRSVILVRQQWKPQDSDVDYDNYPPHSTAAPDLSSRRRLMQQGIMGAAATAASGLLFPTRMRSAWAVEVAEEEKESMYAPKFVQSYADFTEMDGWSYRDVTTGKASSTAASLGDRVVFDWSGYTIGYFGRPCKYEMRRESMKTCLILRLYSGFVSFILSVPYPFLINHHFSSSQRRTTRGCF